MGATGANPFRCPYKLPQHTLQSSIKTLGQSIGLGVVHGGLQELHPPKVRYSSQQFTHGGCPLVSHYLLGVPQSL